MTHFQIIFTFGLNEKISAPFSSLRPYHRESTGSRPITEVKPCRAGLVLGWVTAWEYPCIQWPKCNGPSPLKTEKRNTGRTTKVRGHPHTRPARQLRQGVEPRLTYKVKKIDKRRERYRKKTKSTHSTTNKGDHAARRRQ